MNYINMKNDKIMASSVNQNNLKLVGGDFEAFG